MCSVVEEDQETGIIVKLNYYDTNLSARASIASCVSKVTKLVVIGVRERKSSNGFIRLCTMQSLAFYKGRLQLQASLSYVQYLEATVGSH